MSSTVWWILALALIALGAFLVLTEAHDMYRSREFWRGLRSGAPVEVPDYWDKKYILVTPTLMTLKVVGGTLLGLAGLALAALQFRRNRRTTPNTKEA